MEHPRFYPIGCRLWIGLSIGKFLHRHASHLEAARNFRQTDALQIQLPNGFIALHPLAARLFPLPGSLRTGNGRGNGSRGGSRACHHDLLEGFMMTMKDAFHSLRKVLLQVEAVGNLHRLRGSAAGSSGIVPRAITTDEFDTWMGLEPAFQAAGGAVSKQIDDVMILQVNQNGAIGDVATKCPIVYSKMGRRGMRRQWGPTNEPQKGIRTTSGLEHAGYASARFAAQCKGKLSEHLDESKRLACIA